MGRHAEWRKLAKKLRRKRIRSKLASERDQLLLEEQRKRENSPSYQAWVEEQTILEEFNAAEEKRLAMERQKLWETEEEAALLRWREQQSRLQHAKAEKFKKEMMIKEEWEREQRKIQEAEEARKKTEDEKKRKQAELLAQIDAFIEGKADLPEEVNVTTQTQPGHSACPFFSKTGACRFRDSCSRNHTRPGISRTLLIPNFYDHIGLQSLNQEEYDTDLSLEYEDSETYQHFKEFYNDVLPEFEQCGRVIQFKVCNNEESHLRGNVYVEFQSRRHALKAYQTFQGRFYAGRRLNVEFTNIPSWKNAVCGLFHRQKCPKGKTCNFLHVFRNPNNAFRIQDGHSSSRRQFSRSRSRSPPRRRSRSKEWNWSEGSGSDNETRRKRSRSPSKSRARTKKYDSESETGRSRSRSESRSYSKNHDRDTSRDRRKKRKKERRRDEKYRSRSRSPKYDKKRKDDSRNELYKKNKKDKDDDSKNEKETNGREDFNVRSKNGKDEDKNVTNRDKLDKSDSPRQQEKGEAVKKSFQDKYNEIDKSDWKSSDSKKHSKGKSDETYKNDRKSKDPFKKHSRDEIDKKTGDSYKKSSKDRSDDPEKNSTKLKKRNDEESTSSKKYLDLNEKLSESKYSSTKNKKSINGDL